MKQPDIQDVGNKIDVANNKGFSLIEVLVCIALLAIISVPLFSGFRLAARLNNQAHRTQKVTAYAQEELETIKMLSVDDYKAQVEADGGISVTSGDEWAKLNETAEKIKAGFQYKDSLTQDKLNELFQPFIMEKTNVDIGGRTYKVDVSFQPAEYSQYDQTTAANVNVAGYYDTAQADSAKFPVISNELNLYDGTCLEVLADKIIDDTGKSTASEADILANLSKTIDVEITSSTLEAKTKVVCRVTYAYPAVDPKAKVSYQVYNGNYDLDPINESEGHAIGENSGGSVFLLANALQHVEKNQDGEVVSGSETVKNVLNITYTGDAPVDVYFILNKDASGKLYNFDDITVNGQSYMTNHNIQDQNPGVTAGEMTGVFGDGSFKTNIKINNASILDEEQNTTVGAADYRAITYAVTIDVYDEADGDREAHIEATKIDRG